MDDASIVKHLVKFNGVGPWTAEMMLMFSLMRPDVLSLGDLGIVKGIQGLVPEAQTKEEMEMVEKHGDHIAVLHVGFFGDHSILFL